MLAVEDKLIHWDLSVPKQLKILNLGSVITKLQTDGDVIHCATVGKTAIFFSFFLVRGEIKSPSWPCISK